MIEIFFQNHWLPVGGGGELRREEEGKKGRGEERKKKEVITLIVFAAFSGFVSKRTWDGERRELGAFFLSTNGRTFVQGKKGREEGGGKRPSPRFPWRSGISPSAEEGARRGRPQRSQRDC